MKLIVHRSKPTILFSVLCLLCISCEDFIEIDPPRTEIITETLFETDEGTSAAINGLYSQLVATDNIFNAGLEVFTGLCSDELNDLSDDVFRFDFETSDVSPQNENINTIFWRRSYNSINSANSIIEGLLESPLNSAIKNQVLGEALLIRAIAHFYLVNLFGEVPLVLSTSTEFNETIGKSGVEDIYDQIEADLLEAQSLMFDDFSFLSNDFRGRPNRAAASAFLARIYLYRENWANAEIQASTVIDQSDLFALAPNVNEVFLTGSTEAIWNLVPEPNTNQVRTALIFNLPSFAPTSIWINELNPGFLTSFEPKDARLINWTDTLTGSRGTFIYPHKYKFGFGPLIREPQELGAVFRLAEQYLIRAEARVRQNNISGGLSDLNIIRNRAGLDNITATDQPSMLDAIYLERKHELFVEFGHRWFDLKRTGRAATVLSTVAGKNWQDSDVLWPLPEEELLINPNLLPQNQGY